MSRSEGEGSGPGFTGSQWCGALTREETGRREKLVVFGRVEMANNWVLLKEQSILVVMNLGWRWGTAEREGCSGSAGRLLAERAGNANDGIQTSHCWCCRGC